MASEVVRKLGGSGPVYTTRQTIHGFIATAEAILPLRPGAPHSEVVRVDGQASLSLEGAEESAAIMLLSFLKN